MRYLPTYYKIYRPCYVVLLWFAFVLRKNIRYHNVLLSIVKNIKRNGFNYVKMEQVILIA